MVRECIYRLACLQMVDNVKNCQGTLASDSEMRAIQSNRFSCPVLVDRVSAALTVVTSCYTNGSKDNNK